MKDIRPVVNHSFETSSRRRLDKCVETFFLVLLPPTLPLPSLLPPTPHTAAYGLLQLLQPLWLLRRAIKSLPKKIDLDGAS